MKSSNDLESLRGRLDTSFEIEVFDISASISIGTMFIMFDCIILSDEYDDAGHEQGKLSMKELILNNILNIDDSQCAVSSNNQIMKEAIANSLKLSHRGIKIGLKIVKNQTINAGEGTITVCLSLYFISLRFASICRLQSYIHFDMHVT